ncbi:MAG: diadenylate cyclase [bacterium]|nr:diadenylate cyclase [bacterium]
MDALISFPLLMSIFDPNSPGHDGAIIIENGKVISFSVRLPLSDSNKLPQEFGTRHHAGLGLAEVTDALVLAVSEERGAVSLFYEGNYEPIKDKNELAARIIKHWSAIAPHQLFNQKDISKQKTIKQIALSFVFAFLFWSTVVLTQSELKEMIYTIPIDYISMPKNYLIEGETTNEITVNLLGNNVDLNRINPSQLRAVIDLSKITPGEISIRIDEKNLSIPKQVRVGKTRPSSIQLNIIEMREFDVAIKPQFIGSLPDGFVIDSLAVIPEFIKVLAPVDSVQQDSMVVLTTPIFLETITQTTKIVCNLTAPAKIKPLSNRFPNVEIFLAIREQDQNLPEP